MAKATIKEKVEASIEEKLKSIYSVQLIDSKIDRIRIIRGELPLEVQDLEDLVAGLETRLSNYTEEVNELERQISDKKNEIKEHQSNIKKYESQQNKVRNNREYDAISKEIEFQNLEIQLCEKRIKEFKASIASKQEFLDTAESELEEKRTDLKIKKEELDEIISETEKEEKELLSRSENKLKDIETRLQKAYLRIRSNSNNGLAVVPVERDACGGCFNKIPPQRQLDIRMHKKIIVCEHCGRVLVAGDILTDDEQSNIVKV
ncbi:MAG: zinc ribbon domain-containing protein [Bacteroidota bacterium]